MCVCITYMSVICVFCFDSGDILYKKNPRA